ncbi:MAG TPA: beta-ketoacyl-[acyl-carrier-protein] synthase family protein [Candidatus Polarisedimenticolaceae bacterium]|nr:beta-ketoacyl-[acyl-carrier-protein] synthase family protein [Candidatus Polarisedimenticolaceae bacterium]
MPGADPKHNDNPIVVTGLGAVTAFGWGLSPLWEGLRRGSPAIGPITRFDDARHRTHLAAEVPFQEAPPAPSRRASWADRFAIAASREAMRQAGLTGPVPEAGVFFGSSTGGMLESEAYYASLLTAGARRARPSLLVAQQLNGPGDAVARDAGATGPVETVSSACSSGSMAIGAALRALRRGDVEVAIAGGSDSLCRLTYAGFNALRSVDERPCRPFRKDRVGLSIGEGAGVLILESLARARARGARPIAILAGEAATCDAHHMTAPHPEGRGAAEAIETALADGGVLRDEIDFVNAHGTGTPLNDLAEARAMRRVFGSRTADVPVTSTKALIGHLLGAAGAVEGVATVLSLARREVHPMPAEGDPDEEIGLRLVLGTPLKLPRPTAALSTNLAFGGASATLVFRAAEAA